MRIKIYRYPSPLLYSTGTKKIMVSSLVIIRRHYMGRYPTKKGWGCETSECSAIFLLCRFSIVRWVRAWSEWSIVFEPHRDKDRKPQKYLFICSVRIFFMDHVLSRLSLNTTLAVRLGIIYYTNTQAGERSKVRYISAHVTTPAPTTTATHHHHQLTHTTPRLDFFLLLTQLDKLLGRKRYNVERWLGLEDCDWE